MKAGPASSHDASGLPAVLAQKLIAREAVDAFEWARPLVFTNGVFDILHRGHVEYLIEARALGAALIVGLNTDRSARALAKGPERPLNTQLDRAAVLTALACVSYVAFFDEPTPCELLRRCRPDVYVKGDDYDIERLEETRIVRSWGGRSIAIAFRQGYSTTNLVERIRGT